MSALDSLTSLPVATPPQNSVHHHIAVNARKVILPIIALLSLIVTTPLYADDIMRIHFIDVGQGDATLVELPCGSILIDTGGEKWPKRGRARYESTPHLIDYLTQFFNRRTDLHGRLDLLLLTHAHIDHTRGVADVVSQFSPRNVVFNHADHGSGFDEQKKLMKYGNYSNVGSWYVLERLIDKATGFTNAVVDPINCGSIDPQIRVLWGSVESRPATWGRKDFKNGNNHSVVVRIDFGDASILWTGDLEEGKDTWWTDYDGGIESLIHVYRHTNLLDADVYQVGHHGSHNGTSPELLAEITPELAIISAGPANCERKGFTAYSHGHPREEVVQELEDIITANRSTPASVRTYLGPGRKTPQNLRTVTKAIYSTGWDGTVVLEAKPDGTWTVESLSGQQACIN